MIPLFSFNQSIRLVPLLDIHIGSKTFKEAAFRKTVDYLKRQITNSEPVYWYIDGDAIENVTRDCIASPYDQVITPTQQVEELIKYLTPIKSHGLFAIDGNHAGRTRKRAYYDIMVGLCERLGIKYLGTGGYVRFQVGSQRYNLVTQHGAGAAKDWTLEIRRMRHNYPEGDLYLLGHDHNLTIEHIPYFKIDEFGNEVEDYIVWGRCGNYIGLPDYARANNYEMKPVGSLNIKLNADRKEVTFFKMQYINGELIQREGVGRRYK